MTLPKRWIRLIRHNSFRHCVDVARRYSVTRISTHHHVAHSADIGDNRWQSGSHRLEQ
jgi:hypothetical protein